MVISFFEPRPAAPLDALVSALRSTPAGAEHDIAVVVNRTTEGDLVRSPGMAAATFVVSRPNEGMNIGAWDHAWRRFPAYDGYLFLQDECTVKSSRWLSPFIDAAALPSAGLIGESWNSGWDRSWEVMRKAVDKQAVRGHELNGRPANRVDVYLDFMNRHGVPPGATAGHLRSLAWFATPSTLRAMNGFLCGTSYGECIGAEIAATKSIESLGLRALQVNTLPFCHFGHLEWAQDAAGNWRHVPMTTGTPPPLSPVRPSILARLRAALP